MQKAFLSAYATKIEPGSSNQKQLKLIEDEDMMFCLPHASQYRTLEPPEPEHVFALDLTKYTRKDEISETWLKTESVDEILKKQYIATVVESQTNYSNYLQNLAEVMNKQLRRYVKSLEKQQKNFWHRRTLVDAAYETRRIYVNNLMAERTKINKVKKKKDTIFSKQ